MGIQFCSRITIPHTHINMKFLSALFLAASAAALEDTADVKAAKATFNAAFTAAQTGAHASLAPVQGPTAYLADSADVAAAKAEFAAAFAATPVQGPATYLADSADAAAKADFAAAFAAAEAGEHAALAPKPVEALPVPAAPVVPAYAAAAPFYNGYYGGFYNGYYPHHAAYNYAGVHPYAAAYGAYPYAFAPYTYVKPAEE